MPFAFVSAADWTNGFCWLYCCTSEGSVSARPTPCAAADVFSPAFAEKLSAIERPAGQSVRNAYGPAALSFQPEVNTLNPNQDRRSSDGSL